MTLLHRQEKSKKGICGVRFRENLPGGGKTIHEATRKETADFVLFRGISWIVFIPLTKVFASILPALSDRGIRRDIADLGKWVGLILRSASLIDLERFNMSTVNERFAVFAQWIWDQRHTEKFMHEWVLTEQNKDDATLPKPPLSLAEAKSLLLSLEELKLVFTRDTEMGTAYSPNHVKELEWQEAIKDIRYAIWRRSKSVNLAKRFTLGLILFIASAFVGGVLGAVAKDFYTARIAPRILPTNSSQNDPSKRRLEGSRSDSDNTAERK